MTRTLVRNIFTLTLFLTVSAGGLFAQDPPARVARLNFVRGPVSMEPAGVDDWSPAIPNRPFTTGDYLYTDQGGFAELHTDLAVMRMSPLTSFGFLNLNDQTVQLKVNEGNLYIRVRNLNSYQVFEVDTPNGAVTLTQNGIYRIDVDPNGQTTFVVARSGQMEVTGGGQSFLLPPGEAANVWGTDQLGYEVLGAPDRDQFDNWCMQRDAREASLRAARYLPPTVIGYEDLDDYGDWSSAPQYGTVWYPRAIQGGWAPYHNGHWAWVDPWGWTWVDDTPWGFAPFHYGRWVYVGNRWGWAPGPVAIGYAGPPVRPYYAPAMVAFFGGAHWGVSLSIGGGGPSIGWVSLGFGEVYTPWYHCSQPYFQSVNVANTTIVKTVNITNVYNNVYVNKTVYNQTYVNSQVNGAVTAMPQNAFASGQSVSRAATVVAPQQFSRIQQSSGGAAPAVLAPPVAPTRQAFAPNAGQAAPRPPAQVMARQVVAKTTPPPAPVPVAQKVAYLQQHPGQPFNHAEMRAAVAPQAAAAAPIVRQAPAAATPVKVSPGAHAGNVAAFHQAMASHQPIPASAAAPTAPGRPAAQSPAAAQSKPATAQNPVTQQSKPATAQNPVQNRPAQENRPAAATQQPARPQPETKQVRPQEAASKPAVAAKPAAPAERPATKSAPASERPATSAKPAPAERPATAAKPAPATERPAPAAKPAQAPHGTPPNQQHPPAKNEQKKQEKKEEPKKDTKE